MAPPAEVKPALPGPVNANFIRVLRNSDALVARLALLLSTPSSTDSTLSLLSYSLILASHGVDRLVAARMATVAEQIAARASKSLQPGEAVIASLPVGEVLGAQWARAADTSDRMKKARALVSDYRAFVRLWGLLGMYAWAKGHWNSAPGPRKEGESEEDRRLNPVANPTVRAIVWLQITACVAFQALENVAYLGQHGILKVEPATQGKLYQWSSRGWAVHIVLDLVRLWKTAQMTKQKRKNEAYSAAWDEEDAAWWKKFITDSAWAPIALNYSLNPSYMFLNEIGLGLSGVIASGVSVRELWNKSASRS